MTLLPRHTLAAAAVLLFGTEAAFACASCGCSLATDAATGYSTETGWRASLQFDYIDQDQLRHGTGTIAGSDVAALNNAANGDPYEIEHDTVNRYITFGLAYQPSADWNFRLLVPVIDRGHSTYGNIENPLTPDELNDVHFTQLGDLKLLASWQGLLPAHNLGLQLGIKLPTGNFGTVNAAGTGQVGRNPVTFQNGPMAQQGWPNNLLDPGLQAGTGSTDLILGGFYHQPVSLNFDVFANLSFQAAVAQRLDDAADGSYRPGNSTYLSVGTRYKAIMGFVPQLQVNLAHKAMDSGSIADTADTAGTVTYLSPGLTWSAAPRVQLYGFIQVPVFSRLSGYQLLPSWTASIGVSAGF